VFELICELKSGPLALAGCSTSIDVTGGVVVGVAVGVGTIEGDDVADGVVVGTLLANGLGLVVAGDVQPAIDNEATVTSMMRASNFFSIQTLLDEKINQRRKTGSMKLKNCYLWFSGSARGWRWYWCRRRYQAITTRARPFLDSYDFGVSVLSRFRFKRGL